MAETAAQKKAREEKEAKLREQIEQETREKLEKEFEERLDKERADLKLQQEATAATVSSQASPAVVANDPETEGSVTVHFVDDGLTALGKIWYRGETLTVSPGSENWKMLTDQQTGRMILELSESEQTKKWGRRLFAPGPWPFGGFDLDDENLTERDREKLRSIQEGQATRA